MVHQLGFYGSVRKYVNDYRGVNSRMDELQAAVLSVKLPDLDCCNERRRQIALRYNLEITNPLIVLPRGIHPNVWHIYPVLCVQRDALQTYLSARDIQTQIHYPIPPHKQKAYAEWNDRHYPITEQIASQELSLPCHPSMTDEEVQQVIDALNAFGR